MEKKSIKPVPYHFFIMIIIISSVASEKTNKHKADAACERCRPPGDPHIEGILGCGWRGGPTPGPASRQPRRAPGPRGGSPGRSGAVMGLPASVPRGAAALHPEATSGMGLGPARAPRPGASPSCRRPVAGLGGGGGVPRALLPPALPSRGRGSASCPRHGYSRRGSPSSAPRLARLDVFIAPRAAARGEEIKIKGSTARR